MKELMKRAGDSKEDKVKAIAIQAMRLFAIHPFNDGNKRIVKLMIRNFMEKELKTSQRPHWENLPRKVINRAVRGNNVGPLARLLCENFSIQYDPNKISEVEISPFRIYPDTGQKLYSERKEFKRSLNRLGNSVTFKEPIISREELKALGIESTFFKKNAMCENLLSSTSTESFLHKTKTYHELGKLTNEQAQALIKKLIVSTEGAEGINCELATQKLLTTDVNDLKYAVRFYEKEAVKVDSQSNDFKVSLKLPPSQQKSEISTVRIK